MLLPLIISTTLIFVILIVLPLFISKKAENNSKTLSEWEKIKEYGKKINEETRNKKK